MHAKSATYGPNWYLPAEFHSDPTVAQAAPEHRFGRRHVAARLGKLAIGVAAVHQGT
jgi:hypothetical protein